MPFVIWFKTESETAVVYTFGVSAVGTADVGALCLQAFRPDRRRFVTVWISSFDPDASRLSTQERSDDPPFIVYDPLKSHYVSLGCAPI